MKTGYETPKSGGQPISGFGGFPASGFPTGFIVDSRTRAHRPLQPQYAQGAKHPFLGELAGAVRRYLVTPSVLRLSIQLDRKVRDLARCARLIANHRSFPPSQAHQKQGPFPPPALPGFVGTSDSFRRPDGPPFLRRRLGIATPRPSRASPTDADYLPRMPCSLPRWSGWVIDGCIVGALPRRAFPDPLGLPQSSAGSASTLPLSRPARASRALRPARLLGRQKWALSRGFAQPGFPSWPLDSYRI